VNRVVLDASAILAFMLDEPGAERLTAQVIAGSTAGTVNLAEVASKLISGGDDPGAVWLDLMAYFPTPEPFTADQAEIAANLVRKTRSLGLSLGDRACLALAIKLGCPAWTADRSWKKLSLDVPIHFIR
jgi:PIN domain nuclease of toxin-antitoxin system